MADLELSVASMQACENTVRRVDGAYECSLYMYDEGKLKRHITPYGGENPHEAPVGDLVAMLLDETRETWQGSYPTKASLPIERVVGLTIVRACVRQLKHADKIVNKRLRAELVAAYAVADDIDDFMVAHPASRTGGAVTPAGLRQLRIYDGPMGVNLSALHLPLTPEEEAAHPVSHALLSVRTPATRPHVWVELHAADTRQQFVERRVSREQLYDTVHRA